MLRILCGRGEAIPSTCYILSGTEAKGSWGYAGVHFTSGSVVRVSLDPPSFRVRVRDRWIPFLTLENHVHLLPGSRHWPSYPKELALLVCRGVPESGRADGPGEKEPQ